MTRPRLLTVDEVADRTTLAESTLYDWASRGRGPRSFRLGGRRVWDESDVEAWIDEQRRSGDPA